MADVSKVGGPSGSPESFGKKDKGSVDADKFKEAMRRRVTEVSQVDPDEQKKRKRREEVEEEEPTDAEAAGPATPASQVTPFSLKEEPKKTSPLDMQKGGPGISPTESAQKSTLPSPHTAAFFQNPSTDEMADDSGVLEEEAFIENVPSSPREGAPPTFTQTAATPPETPPVSQAPYPPQLPETMPSQSDQPTLATPQSTPQGTRPEKKPAQQPYGPPSEKKPVSPGLEPKLSGLKSEQQKQAGPLKSKRGSEMKPSVNSPSVEDPTAKVQDTTGFFEHFGKEAEEGKQKIKTPDELAEETAAIQGVPSENPNLFTEALEGKKEKKVEEKDTPADAGLAETAIPGEAPAATALPAAPEPLPSYANMHPQVMEIFDRMVGVMTVMNMTGMTETVITLNAPQFASSVFFGTQIIIQEFSSAPQVFNIQLNGNPQAVALFQGNANDLMAAFQAGNYNFRVNRLETGHLAERPLFKRKDPGGGKDKDTGDNPQ